MIKDLPQSSSWEVAKSRLRKRLLIYDKLDQLDEVEIYKTFERFYYKAMASKESAKTTEQERQEKFVQDKPVNETQVVRKTKEKSVSKKKVTKPKKIKTPKKSRLTEKPSKKISKKKVILVIAIIFGAFVVIPFLYSQYSQLSINTVQEGDLVKIHYWIWEDTPKTPRPLLRNEIRWFLTVDRNDMNNDNESMKMIPGLYDIILWKPEGYESDYVSLKSCTDNINRNGIDDYSEDDPVKKECSSYGRPEDGDLYGRPIVIKFEVLKINKTIT